jgi:formylglycine-generating enzyme required for sulfatase activity
MLKLRVQLQEWDAKNAAAIAEMTQKATDLRNQCQFQEAAAVLGRIPEELATSDSDYLLSECQKFSFDRQTALKALQAAMLSENYAQGLTAVGAYFKQISSLGLRDSLLEKLYQTCKQALQTKKKAEEATKIRQLLFLTIIPLIAIVLIVGAGLWFRSSGRANSIAAAVREQRWDDALALDPNNLEVFLGRADQELNKSNWVPWKVTADLDRASAIAPNNPRLMSLKTLAAEKVIAEKDKAEADQIAAEKAKAEADQIAAEKAKADSIVAASPLVNSIGLELKKLPAGKFVMGEGSVAHEVTLTRPFYLGVYEVTQAQYEQVMGVNPSKNKGAQNPVDSVSWEDAVEFCRRLSELPEEKAAGRVYRLPTEAEWEYACRAGTTTKFSIGDDTSTLGEYAWIISNSGGRTHPVGEKKPNAWAFYDMHGNVWEWCADWYVDFSYVDYLKDAVSNPVGPFTGSQRVFRGGSWDSRAADCRSASRASFSPSVGFDHCGFRVALSSSGIPR